MGVRGKWGNEGVAKIGRGNGLVDAAERDGSGWVKERID